MSDFLQRKVAKMLQVMNLYDPAYRGWFYFSGRYSHIKNLCYKHFSSTAPILMYHRIVDLSADPRSLAVSPDIFEQHIKFLSRHYKIIPLSELVHRIKNHNLFGDEIAITFDDGYQDNYVTALPILEKYNAPATIFITTGYLGQIASFPWDLEYKNADRAVFLNQDELRTLAHHPLIDLGAHTVSHRRMVDLSEEEIRNEMLQSKETLEGILDQEITMFAYPFGRSIDIGHCAIEQAKLVGFAAAFSTIEELVTPRASVYFLPRFNMRNFTPEELAHKILTFGRI